MPISIELPREIEERLDNVAALAGLRKADCLTQLVLDHLEDLEDLYEAEEEMKAIRAGLVNPISLEELMREYGMEH